MLLLVKKKRERTKLRFKTISKHPVPARRLNLPQQYGFIPRYFQTKIPLSLSAATFLVRRVSLHLGETVSPGNSLSYLRSAAKSVPFLHVRVRFLEFAGFGIKNEERGTRTKAGISPGNFLPRVPLMVHPTRPSLHQPPIEPPHPLCSLYKQQPERPRVFEARSRGPRNLPPGCARIRGGDRPTPSPLGGRLERLRRRSAGPRQRKTESDSHRQYGGRSSPERTSKSSVDLSPLTSYTRATSDRFALPPPVGLLRTLLDLSRSFGDNQITAHRCMLPPTVTGCPPRVLRPRVERFLFFFFF